MFGPSSRRLAESFVDRMLGRVLYQVPSGEDEGRNREATGGPHFLHIQIGGASASTKEDSRGGEPKVPSPQGNKRTTSEDLETEASKRGKKTSQGGRPSSEP